ncbi:MAG: hypothetical protein COV45_02725 [Deltaproteobacteria bacterium CG11_big_fil_rev_8_21_14_0_20_47_16]|nr:MAG: hypothetical protein COV45_02725 [Deltaproteobacteria bacterium CG11_big_fil_rev_8_21_14_0_20_47_16]
MTQSSCDRVGLTPQVIKRYADYANTLLKVHQIPASVIAPNVFSAAVKEVSDHAAEVCAPNSTYTEKAQAVVGYVMAAEAVDTALPLHARYEQYQQNLIRFNALETRTHHALWAGVNRYVTFVTDQFGAVQARDTDPIPAEQTPLLSGLIQKVVDLKRAGKSPVVLFDLDDTLFSPANRQLQIVHEFIEKNPSVLSPSQMAALQVFDTRNQSYDLIVDIQSRLGIADATFLKSFKSYWFGRFFSNLAAVDPAHPGAARYVHALQQAGATVVYLTGRQLTGDKPETKGGMKEGTLESLRRNGFPMPNGKDVQLFMKDRFEMHDVDYKATVVPQIKKFGELVACFDNDPKGNALCRKEWADTTVVRVGRSHASNPTTMKEPDGKERPVTLQDLSPELPNVKWIHDFRMNQTTSTKVDIAPNLYDGIGCL